MKYSKTFNHELAQWDRYRHFHNALTPFVRFITGELMVESIHPTPAERRVYPEFGVALTHTTDGHFEFLTPAGVTLPKAQLNYGGGQYLLVDLESKQAVRLHWNVGTNAPTHLNYARAYILGEGGTLVGAPVRYAPPLAKDDPARDWMKQARGVAQGIVALEPETYDGMWAFWDSPRIDYDEMAQRAPAAWVRAQVPRMVKKVAEYGIEVRRRVHAVPYVCVR